MHERLSEIDRLKVKQAIFNFYESEETFELEMYVVKIVTKNCQKLNGFGIGREAIYSMSILY